MTPISDFSNLDSSKSQFMNLHEFSTMSFGMISYPVSVEKFLLHVVFSEVDRHPAKRGIVLRSSLNLTAPLIVLFKAIFGV